MEGNLMTSIVDITDGYAVFTCHGRRYVQRIVCCSNCKYGKRATEDLIECPMIHEGTLMENADFCPYGEPNERDS
jgi:hypothetical protein